MQIGLRTLGGDPEAFYRLSRERQLDVLAVLQVEQCAPVEEGAKSPPEIVGPPSALSFWSHVTG